MNGKVGWTALLAVFIAVAFLPGVFAQQSAMQENAVIEAREQEEAAAGALGSISIDGLLGAGGGLVGGILSAIVAAIGSACSTCGALLSAPVAVIGSVCSTCVGIVGALFSAIVSAIVAAIGSLCSTCGGIVGGGASLLNIIVTIGMSIIIMLVFIVVAPFLWAAARVFGVVGGSIYAILDLVGAICSTICPGFTLGGACLGCGADIAETCAAWITGIPTILAGTGCFGLGALDLAIASCLTCCPGFTCTGLCGDYTLEAVASVILGIASTCLAIWPGTCLGGCLEGFVLTCCIFDVCCIPSILSAIIGCLNPFICCDIPADCVGIVGCVSACCAGIIPEFGILGLCVDGIEAVISVIVGLITSIPMLCLGTIASVLGALDVCLGTICGILPGCCALGCCGGFCAGTIEAFCAYDPAACCWPLCSLCI